MKPLLLIAVCLALAGCASSTLQREADILAERVAAASASAEPYRVCADETDLAWYDTAHLDALAFVRGRFAWDEALQQQRVSPTQYDGWLYEYRRQVALLESKAARVKTGCR